MDLQELFNSVRQWGVSKGITGPEGKGTLLGQLSKSQEELTETRDAAILFIYGADHMLNKKGETVSVVDELEDGIGDTIVTQILAAERAGLTAERCLLKAFNVISKRTGKMEKGVFVKDVEVAE